MTLYPDLGSQAYPPTSPIPPLVGPPNMGNLQYQPGWTQPAGYGYPQYLVLTTLSYPTGNYAPHTSVYPPPRVSPQGFHPLQRYQSLYIPPVPLVWNPTPTMIHPDPELTTFSPWEVSSVSTTMATPCQNDTQRTQLDPVSMEISAEVTPPQLENTETLAEALRTPGSPGSFHTGVPPDWEAPRLRQEQAPPPEA